MTASIALAQAAIALRNCVEAAAAADAGLKLARLPVQVALLAHAPVVLAALPAMSLPGNRIQLTLIGADLEPAAQARPARAPLQLVMRYRVGFVAQSALAIELLTGLIIDTVAANAVLAIPASATDPVEAALLAAPGLDRQSPLMLLLDPASTDSAEPAMVLRLRAALATA